MCAAADVVRYPVAKAVTLSGSIALIVGQVAVRLQHFRNENAGFRAV